LHAEHLPKWKEQALSVFPELANDIQTTETPYALWLLLRTAFENAYGKTRNETLIRRIYGYAKWCCQQPSGQTAADDLFTCVAVCFYEHIPENTTALADMPRWFSLAEVTDMKDIFTYHIGEKGFQEILKTYKKKR
jgi:hypothetical protein